MNKKNIKKFIFPVSVFIILSILYFFIPIMVMPDSTEYYDYLRIYNGVAPFSEWNVVRGFTLPTILFLVTTLFGNNSLGLVIGTYIFYAIYLIVSYYIYIKVKSHIDNKTIKYIMAIIYYVLIAINPIYFGYFHGLLTEFVAIPVGLIACIMSIKFLNYKLDLKNVKTYLYLLWYIFLFIFCWFLKQPYFTIALFPLMIAIFLSIFKYKSIKDFLMRIGNLFISLIILVISIVSWEKILVSAGVDYESGRNNEHFLKEAVINGISDFRFDETKKKYTLEDLENDELIDSKELNVIKNSKNKYKIINVYDRDKNLVDKMVLYYEGKDYSTKDAIGLWGRALVKHPLLVMHSYVDGYLATIDVFVSDRAMSGIYYPVRLFLEDFNHENDSIGLIYLHNKKNFVWLQDRHLERVENLEEDIAISDGVINKVLNYSEIHFISFKLLFFILPLSVAIMLFMYLFKKRRSAKIEASLMFLGFALLHTLFHVVTGAIIDRYVYIVFVEVVLGYIILFIPNKKIKKSSMEEVNMKLEVKKNKNPKTIFVIPAYNESKHIAEVIKDIRKCMPKADIVVTNDCSTDNTREIVESLGVPCLTHPFNMGYAMACKSGIKYACEKGYDYVIQSDADGQHIPSEAKKLVDRMEETGANIVIGSRFLSKTDYKHPFFRRVGTKMFQIIIKIFCHKKITDPTSGFQLLDRSVIERYAKIGKYPEFPDANLIIEMLQEGYKIEEVSVKMKLNDQGTSMHGGIIKPIKYMINVMYSIVFILLRGRKRSK